jgi:lysophospholipase L1-like esterase
LKSTIVLVALAAVAAAASAFAVALLFVPGFDAATRWRLHLEDRGYGSFGERLHRDHLLKDRSVGDGRILLIGDSHAAALDQARLGALAVNYGIGGETMLGVSEQLPSYRAVQSARAIVLIAGFNDLRYRAPEDVHQAFEKVREQTRGKPLYVVSIMPIREGARADATLNERIAETDELLRKACDGDCRYIDVASEFSSLAPEERELLYLGDGVHLTPFAYELLIGAIGGALCEDGVYGEAGRDVCA